MKKPAPARVLITHLDEPDLTGEPMQYIAASMEDCADMQDRTVYALVMQTRAPVLSFGREGAPA